jgi:hypothetical protein
MKILKNILIALLVIVIIVLAGIYFLPEDYSVTRSVEIERPINEVATQVSDFNRWNSWSPWYETEPEAKLTIEGTPATIGHKMSWEGEKNGVGSLTIVAITDTSIEGNLEFIKPFTMTSIDLWTFRNQNGKTTVIWTSTGKLSYPLGRLFGLGLDEMLGADKERGLKKLKELCEHAQNK